MSVLLVTRSDDNASVARVADALARRGHAPIRLDTDLYPTRVRLATRLSTSSRRPLLERSLETDEGRFDLEDVTAVWYRRFHAGARLPAELGDLRPASVEEARRSLYGMIAALPVPQMDPLEAVRRCDHKEMQLVRARALGLDVPRTLFTNDPGAVRAFFEECDGRVVTKMQSSFAVHRGGLEHVVFTSVVDRDAFADLDGLRYCPMTFQEHLEKRRELRVTVVGDQVHVAAVDSQKLARTRVDWRKDGVALLTSWTKASLPRATEQALLALLAEIGLRYGAADFVETPDGRLVFLEVNAGGEWFWLDESQPGGPGLPIAEAIADELTRPGARGSTARPPTRAPGGSDSPPRRRGSRATRRR